MRTNTLVVLLMTGVFCQAASGGFITYTMYWNNVHQVADPDQSGWAVQSGGDTLTVAFSHDRASDPALVGFVSGVSYSMNDVATMINQAFPQTAHVIEDHDTGNYCLHFHNPWQPMWDGNGDFAGSPEDVKDAFDIWKVSGAADLSELTNFDSVEDDFYASKATEFVPFATLIDFSALKNNFGMTSGATPQQGDWDLDGDIDLADFFILKCHFAGAAPTVPEPASVALMLLGACAALKRRRR